MVTKPPTVRDVFQCPATVPDSSQKKQVVAIIAIEMVQKVTATPSVSVKNAAAGSATWTDDIGAPSVANLGENSPGQV